MLQKFFAFPDADALSYVYAGVYTLLYQPDEESPQRLATSQLM